MAAFDPGQTTGWARWCGRVDGPDLRATLRAGAVEQGELRSRASEFSDWVTNYRAANNMVQYTLEWMVANEFVSINGDRMAWVIEDFILRPGPHGSKRAGLSPVRMTCWLLGAIHESNTIWDYNPIVPQSASQAKGFMTDARLKAVGWWAVGKPHSRDALRHTATYVAAYRQIGRAHV